MPPELLARLTAWFAEHPDLLGRPATDLQIEAAQRTLSVVFDAQYVAYIKQFGGSFAGFEIHAFENGPMIGRETVTELTQWFRRSLGEAVPIELRDALVISGDGGGNAILINSRGEIILHLHEENEIELLYPSLHDMIGAGLP
ncbi:cell wall assembly protein [Stenotrophomonas sp. ZAC14D2_NAIMI4_7]|uniref:SMI1/KNR4 family protein n=1 Tax=Stenotrophomonas sp. ZAC14D2_NAIMI4_7 TaxID=2072405 RepID=UPI000D5408FD|nr:SMI1/KNR4 family protein [Stenotrophomonas sp. ZAC14D2_NAIMI4_7]AWH18872.1 cell wall assembly protein [Stenotrophomonas sp. ZAC14D2_NAIMI4_7]